MKIVELKTAYHWHCEDCGADNFALPQKAEMTGEDREEAFRRFHGLDQYAELPDRWQDFELVMIPDFVECSRCGSEFSTDDERNYLE